MAYYDYGATGVNPWYGGQYPQMSNPYMQPQMQQNMQNCQCDNRFMWIQGKEAAKAYPVAPDKTIFFLDDKESYAYLKKTDRDGKTTEFKTFKLVEETDDSEIKLQTQPDVVTKDEFDNFASTMRDTLDGIMDRLNSMNQKPRYNNNYKGKVNNNG